MKEIVPTPAPKFLHGAYVLYRKRQTINENQEQLSKLCSVLEDHMPRVLLGLRGQFPFSNGCHGGQRIVLSPVLFMQQILIVLLLHARCCFRAKDIAVNKTDKNPGPTGAYILVVGD